jgi:hypothetical protein
VARRSLQDDQDLIDISQAAALVRRHPETIRRWVWSGRLSARRRGRQLLVAGSDVCSLAGVSTAIGFRQWADEARAWQASTAAAPSGRSAADLVIEDRATRSTEVPRGARR